MTIRELINELVKYDPRIQVVINDQSVKNFELKETDESEIKTEILNIKG